MANKLSSLALPIYVFLDTEVFIRLNYDFKNNSSINIMINHCRNNKVKLLTSDIVINELKSNFKKEIEEKIKEINNKIEYKKFTNLEISPFRPEDKLDVQIYIFRMNSIIDGFFSKEIFYKLDISDIKIDNILHDYFSNKTPFINKDKKSEFPDAFNLSMIRNNEFLKNNINGKNKKIVIITNDSDFEGADDYILYKSIEDFLEDLSEKFEINNNINSYVSNNINYFISFLHNKFLESHDFIQNKLSINGVKYYINGVNMNITNIHDLLIKNINIGNISEINILGTDTTKNSEIINIKSDAILDISYMFEVSYGTNVEVYIATEKHRLPFSANVGIPCDYKEYDIYDHDTRSKLDDFLNKDVRINTNFILGEGTLISKNLNLVNSNPINTNYICPSCGVELTPLNDCGGVCTNCYSGYNDHF